MFTPVLSGGKGRKSENLNCRLLLTQACGMNSRFPCGPKNHPEAKTLKWYSGAQ